MTNGSTSTTADLGALARPGTNRRALIARVEELVPEAEQATVFAASLGLRHDETGFRMGVFRTCVRQFGIDHARILLEIGIEVPILQVSSPDKLRTQRGESRGLICVTQLCTAFRVSVT